MTLTKKLENLSVAYNSINVNVYHYWRPRMEAPFIVWQEDGGESFTTGNHVAETAVSGTTDYYSKTEFDPVIDEIETAQNTVDGLFWSLNSVQYEDETGLIHHEWRWRYLG